MNQNQVVTAAKDHHFYRILAQMEQSYAGPTCDAAKINISNAPSVHDPSLQEHWTLNNGRAKKN